MEKKIEPKGLEYLRLISAAIQVETVGTRTINRPCSKAPGRETLSWVIIL
jgi:hypothetical protein